MGNEYQKLNIRDLPLFSRLKDNKGSALMTSFITMLVLVGFSLSMGSTKTTKFSGELNHKFRSKSHYIAMGGIEYARFQINKGVSPVANGVSLGGGTFDVDADPQNRTVQIASQFNNVITEKTFKTEFGADCLEIPKECSEEDQLRSWEEGGIYEQWEHVQHNGNEYECIIYNACGLAFYEPGVGDAWDYAWIDHGPYTPEGDCEEPGSPLLPSISMSATQGLIKNLEVTKVCMDRIVIDRVKISWTDDVNHPDAEIGLIEFDAAIVFTNIEPLAGEVIENKYVDIEDAELIDDLTTHTVNLFLTYPESGGPGSPNEFTVTFELLDGSSVSRTYTYETVPM